MSWRQNCINADCLGPGTTARGLPISDQYIYIYVCSYKRRLWAWPGLSLDATGWHFNFQLQQIAYNVYAYRPGVGSEKCCLIAISDRWQDTKSTPNDSYSLPAIADRWSLEKKINKKYCKKTKQYRLWHPYRNRNNLKSIHQNLQLIFASFSGRWFFDFWIL